jgi:hypothetical protein
MKQLLLVLFLLISTALSYNVHAVNSHPPVMSTSMAVNPQMTIQDFLSIDFKAYRNAEGKKIKWTQRLALTISQKGIAKKVSKGKIERTAPLSTALSPARDNIHGLLSIIFAFTGLFIPIIGFGMIIAALILGIIGIRRDANPTMAIIGTAVSGAFILLLLIALVIIASGCWIYC